MAKKTVPPPAPLTFDLPVSLIEKIDAQREALGMTTTSEVVRHAIASYDYESYESGETEHRQISVRLPALTRTALAKTAKKKSVSVGELLRAAIINMPDIAPPAKPAKGSKSKS